MPITPEATMTNSYRKALAKYIADGTSPALTSFVFGSGGNKNDIATIKGNITSGSEIVTAVSDFSNLKLTQLVKGVGSNDNAYISNFDETEKTITLSQKAGLTQPGASLTLSGPIKEDPTRDDLFARIEEFSKPVQPNDKQLSADGYSATVTCTIEDNQLDGKNISEFGILDPKGDLAYYFTFREIHKTVGDAYQLQIIVKF